MADANNGHLIPESKKLLSMVASLLPNIKQQTLPAHISAAFQRDYMDAQTQTPMLTQTTREVSDVAYPTTFNLTGNNGVPLPIMREIRDTLKKEIRTEFALGTTKVVLMFYTHTNDNISRMAINRVAIWLRMIYKYKDHHKDPTCTPKTLVCWFYMTNAKKIHGRGNDTDMPLSAINANTAFTRTCVRNVNEIVVYRKEEWFKVFIHETIHTFGLDFSAADETSLEQCATRMRALFGGIKKDNCEVNLYEAYTEFWAEITNILFIAGEGDSRRINAMLSMEAAFGQQQMHKVLDFMGLQYSKFRDASTNSTVSTVSTKYREKTSILAYYIIKNILLNNTTDFFATMAPKQLPRHYVAYIDFGNKTIDNFCNFIESHKEMVEEYNKELIGLPTMRMTAWENTV